MKKKVFVGCIIIGLLFVYGSYLLPFDGGIKLGISWVNANFSQDIPGVEFSSRSEFIIGAFFSVNLIKLLAIQPEVYYIKRGVDFTEGDEFTSQKFSYLEIPVLLKFKILTKGKIMPGIFIGPYLAFNTKATAVVKKFGITTENDMEEFAKSTDYGLVFGGYLEYGLGTTKLVLDVRYNLGLVNALKNLSALTSGVLDDDDYVKNASFTIMIGFAF